MVQIMKVVSSLKTLKVRDRNCQIVKRRGRLYVINKRNPRFKARQGWFNQLFLSNFHKLKLNFYNSSTIEFFNQGSNHEDH